MRPSLNVRRWLLAAALASPSLGAAQNEPAPAPLWRYTATSDILGLRWASIPDSPLYLVTKSGVVCLDPVTGERRWVREDLPLVTSAAFSMRTTEPEGDSRTIRGYFQLDKRMEVVDLATGAGVAGSAAWSVDEARGFLPVPRHPMVLLVAKTGKNTRQVLGIATDRGEVRWRQDSLFGRNVEFLDIPLGMTRGTFATLSGNQRPVVDSDSTAILYLSKDGPMKVGLTTGAVLWRTAALAGKEVPTLSDAYAPMLLADSVLYVPSEKSLLALRVSDGTPRWDRGPALPGRIIRMELTQAGLLVSGADRDYKTRGFKKRFVALIDPASGASRWTDGPREIEYTTPFVVHGDSAYLATEKSLLALPLAGGPPRTVATLNLKGRDPEDLEFMATGVLVYAGHTLVLVGVDGSDIYRHVFDPPSAGLLSALGSHLLMKPGKRLATGGVSGNHVYLVDNSQDASGSRQLALLRIEKGTGTVEWRLPLTKTPQDMEVDEAARLIYLQTGDKEIMAVRFP